MIEKTKIKFTAVLSAMLGFFLGYMHLGAPDAEAQSAGPVDISPTGGLHVYTGNTAVDSTDGIAAPHFANDAEEAAFESYMATQGDDKAWAADVVMYKLKALSDRLDTIDATIASTCDGRVDAN